MCKLHVFTLVLLLASGCKPETSIDDYPCPKEGTKLTYESFGRDFLGKNCQICHGQPTSDRKGAPEGFDFGTLEAVRDKKSRIFARAAAGNATMPPGPDKPPAADGEKLGEWLACGAP